MNLTTFGESHGPAIGGIITGIPAGILLDFDAIAADMARRRPGADPFSSQRCEKDEVQFLSGISPDGITLGTPIGFIIPNCDARSNDYEAMKGKFRPNHADYTWWKRFGIIDWRGGGHASGRLTACTVAAGAIARQILAAKGITVSAYPSRIGNVALEEKYPEAIPSQPSQEMLDEISAARNDLDSVGGIVSCRIRGLKAGIGNPNGHKLQSALAAAMMSINAAKGFEYGLGFEAAKKRGSECLDLLTADSKGNIVIPTNFSGGIQGGISNGNDICFSVAFKPTPSIARELPTVDTEGHPCTIKSEGRHDPCIVLRAVPVVEAEAAMVIVNALEQ